MPIVLTVPRSVALRIVLLFSGPDLPGTTLAIGEIVLVRFFGCDRKSAVSDAVAIYVESVALPGVIAFAQCKLDSCVAVRTSLTVPCLARVLTAIGESRIQGDGVQRDDDVTVRQGRYSANATRGGCEFPLGARVSRYVERTVIHYGIERLPIASKAG